jgi:hypothetical protein
MLADAVERVTRHGYSSAVLVNGSGPDPTVVYVVWQDSRFNGGAFDEVAISSSTNGGKTWSTPKRVNSPSGHPAFTPMVAVKSAHAVGVTAPRLPTRPRMSRRRTQRSAAFPT